MNGESGPQAASATLAPDDTARRGSATLRNVELLLEQLPREDRLGYFDELPAEVQDAFWRELGVEADDFGDQDRYGWHRRPRVGGLWDVRKYPTRRQLRVVKGGQHRTGELRPTDDVLHEIPPPVYVDLLAGAEVPQAGGMIRCPLPGHRDSTPSFRVYDCPERGFYCFGCHAAGDVYNFAAALWGMDTRRDFRELRRLIAAALLGEVAA